MKKLLLVATTLVLTSCAYVQSVSQTSIPRDRRNLVTAKVERNIIFMFNFDNNYIDTLTSDLQAQCPKGSVKGILTKDESITYFPIIFHKSVVTASGYCVGAPQARKQQKRRRTQKRRS